MAKKSPTKKKKSLAQKGHSNAYKVLVIVGLVIAGIVAVVLLVKITEYNKAAAVQKGMYSYLKQKYNQDFVVEPPELTGKAFGVDGTWQSSAYPNHDATLRFSIGRSEYKESYSDQYIPATWAKAETARIQPDVKRIFEGIPVDVSVQISIQSPLSDEDKVNLTLTSPTYEEVKQKYSNSITNFIRLDFDKKPKNIAMVAERAYALMQLVKQEGVKEVYLKYREKGQDGKQDMGSWCASRQTGSQQEIKTCFEGLSPLKPEEW